MMETTGVIITLSVTSLVLHLMIYSEHTSKISSVFSFSNLQVSTYVSNINEKIKTNDDTCKHLLNSGKWHDFNWNNLTSTNKNFNKWDGMKLRRPVIRRINEPGFWTYSGKFYTTKCNYHWYTPEEIRTCLLSDTVPTVG